ncbi:MAG: DUF4019 domain-containing protein [Brevundimonas sp.]
MNDVLQALTEREKDALRLLASGHDAKSVARQLELSVHTVNERLRTARRKMGVSSSRAAARHLAQAEQGDPKFFGDKKLGAVEETRGVGGFRHSQNRRGLLSVWRIGGLVVMLLIAAAALIYGHSVNPDARVSNTPQAAAATATYAVPSDAVGAAQAWVALLDKQQWNESWRTAGTAFKTQVTPDAWAANIRSVRETVGPVASRVEQSATRTTTLPGAPAGDYVVIQYQTAFGNKSGAIETIALMREGSDWKVNGYFIR